jgi:glycosyltransferase involved in cell wall biosynthesis
MKVLHCITGLGSGGAQVMLFRFLSGLGDERKNHEVVSLLPHAHFSKEIEKLGVKVTSADIPQGKFSIAGLRKVRAHIAEFNPDVIHGWMYHGNFAATLANFGLGPASRVIWSVHHSLHDLSAESKSTRLLLKISAPLSKRLGAITYCSKQSEQQHSELGFAKGRKYLIPNGTDLSLYRANPNGKKYLCDLDNIPNDRFIIGNINRNHPMKDQLSLVKATKSLIDRGKNIHLVLVGEGHEGSDAAKAAQEFGILDRVTMLGARNDIPQLMPGLDLFTLSSAWGEAFPLSVGEAMSCEVPAVVTRVGDCDWLVGDTGIVVEPKNVTDLANAIDKVMQMPSTQKNELGKAARARIADLFSLELYIKSHTDLYAKVKSSNTV